MNFHDDSRALKFVRQFHNKRIWRFLAGKEYSWLEDQSNLEYSKEVVKQLDEILNG